MLAAVFAAVAFTAFRSFAYNAVAGPEGHLPGIVFLIFALWLTVRRRWYLAGVAAALAFLTWQPLFVYPIAVLGCAVAWSPGRRWRAAGTAVAGIATPTVLLIGYYSWGGHLRQLWDGRLWFPLTGVGADPCRCRTGSGSSSTTQRTSTGAGSCSSGSDCARSWPLPHGRSRARAHPPAASPHSLVLLVGVTLIVQLGRLAYDYIGYPHSFPMLPYAAAGLGWGVARLLAVTRPMRWVRPVIAAAPVVIALFSAVLYS